MTANRGAIRVYPRRALRSLGEEGTSAVDFSFVRSLWLRRTVTIA